MNKVEVMDTQPTISIIVPVYNVAPYLRKCLDSILAQTFTNYELIIVNDGSTDNSGSICDEYAVRDPRIKVLHKSNGGLSSARNYGIEHACGQYLGFVDSDDYIAEDMYELLYNNIINENADIAECSFFEIFQDVPRIITKQVEYIVANREEAILLMLEGGKASVPAWNKLYKASLFDTIRYPEGKFFEDAFIVIELLDKCQKVVFTTAQKYYYIRRDNSITNSSFRMKDLEMIEAYEHNQRLIQRYYPQFQEAALMRVCWANFMTLDKLILSDNKAYHKIEKQIILYLKQHIRFILRAKHLSKGRKLSALLLMIDKNLYRICVQLQKRRYQIIK